MKFYIASSFKNIDTVRYVSEKLIRKGFIHTYDWTQNERDLTIEQLREIGQKEKTAVIEADFIIVLLPVWKREPYRIRYCNWARQKNVSLLTK